MNHTFKPGTVLRSLRSGRYWTVVKPKIDDVADGNCIPVVDSMAVDKTKYVWVRADIFERVWG